MDTLAKITVGGALALGAASANATISLPSSGSSDAILFAEVVTSTGTVLASYAGDTGVSISNLAHGTNTSPTVLSGDANLSALFAADHTGDTLYWALQGAQYTGPDNATNFKTPGTALFITTASGNNTGALATVETGNIVSWAGGLAGDIGLNGVNLNLNLGSHNSVEGTNVASAGIWDINNPTGTASGWYGQALIAANTTLTATLYSVTGGNSKAGPISYATLETATLSANGLQFSTSASVPDSYNAGTLTMPTLGIGSATYTNTKVMVNQIVTLPHGTSPDGPEDTYDPATGLLTVQAVKVGSTTYYNAVVSIKSLVSIGSVTDADSYADSELTIGSVQVGGTVFTDVVVTVAGIDSYTGGMPNIAMDSYTISNRHLAIAAVQVGPAVYTNVVITVGNLIRIGGASPEGVPTDELKDWVGESGYLQKYEEMLQRPAQ